MYKQIEAKMNFPQMEEDILRFWKQEEIFKKSIEQREEAEEFVFYDGPPFATGLPHFGHFVPGTIKDIIPRYQTMLGRRVMRRFGWDCHGLPVEYEMEKELGISGRHEIEEYGVGAFNEACRSIVLRFTAEWERTVERMGRWVDFRNDYKTMDREYMESIWWVFKQLWAKGLIYEGFYILPYSPKLATPLSNFEVNLGGYKNVSDPAVTVKFEVKCDASATEPSVATFFLAWTTTPWTLPSNLGLALGPNISYVMVEDKPSADTSTSTKNTTAQSERYILAEDLLPKYYKSEAAYTVIQRYEGTELLDWQYKPLFPYFSEQEEKSAFRTHLGSFVTTDEGTGIVHLAPGFGEDDYNILKNTGVDIIVPIDAEARFTSEVPDFEGLFVKDADKAIIAALKEQNAVVKRENYLHNYPHCYRTGSPLIYRAISSWFVDISKIKHTMLEANNRIRWMPEHLQKGRFGNWLENAREWAISRNRFWGNPIPVWKCTRCGKVECIGSLEELHSKSGVVAADLHKHIVDEISWDCDCNARDSDSIHEGEGGSAQGRMQRVPEVLDCWFESGAMPYAQKHYPFENKEEFEANFPAHFIAEGLDQTRGWFYTLTVLAAALFEKPAFRQVVVNGLVLAEDGRKMAKKEKNYSNPITVINTYGADALRLFLMNSSVVKSEDLKYSDSGVRDVLKSVLLPLWNSYSFFATYANIDGFTPSMAVELSPSKLSNPLDLWILSELQSLVDEVRANLDAYDLHKAVIPLVRFIDILNNWYIRRSRRRFWRSENDSDKIEAYSTLHRVLLTLSQVSAPFIPFISEEIYRNIISVEVSNTDPTEDSQEDMRTVPESVHLCSFPESDSELRNTKLERKMSLVQQAVSMGRAIRNTHNLKVRQPLSAIHLVTIDTQERNILFEMEDIIRDELNVKEVILRDNELDLVEYEAKANFKELGMRLGSKMKNLAQEIAKFSSSEIQSLLQGNIFNIDIDGRVFELSQSDIVVKRNEKEGLKILNEGNLTVALNSQITDELLQEGQVRDLVRAIQNLRKESGFHVSDRIAIRLQAGEEIVKAVKSFRNYFTQEVLCSELIFTQQAQDHELLSGSLSLSIAKLT